MDCKNCVNCDFIRGFMCTCHYSYNEGDYHIQVGQDVHRKHANKCEYYSEKMYERNKYFII